MLRFFTLEEDRVAGFSDLLHVQPPLPPNKLYMASRETLVPNDRPIIGGPAQNEGIVRPQAATPMVLWFSTLRDKMGQGIAP
jgi:hypothetical protein